MEYQVEKNVHFQHLLFFAFNQGSKAAKAACDIFAVYGENAITSHTSIIRTAHTSMLSSKLKTLISKMHPILAVQQNSTKND